VCDTLGGHRVTVSVGRRRQCRKRRKRRSPFVGTGREQLDERANRRVDGVVVSISSHVGNVVFGVEKILSFLVSVLVDMIRKTPYG